METPKGFQKAFREVKKQQQGDNSGSSSFRAVEHSQDDPSKNQGKIDVSPPLNEMQQQLRKIMADTAKGQDISKQASTSESSSTHMQDYLEVYYTSEGDQVQILQRANAPDPFSNTKEKQWLRSNGFAGKVEKFAPPTNTNSYAYVLLDGGEGIISERVANIILADNYESSQNHQVKDVVRFFRSSSNKLIDLAIVTEVSDRRASKVRGQLRTDGPIYQRGLDVLSDVLNKQHGISDVRYEILHPKEGAALRAATELFVPAEEDYVTSEGRSTGVFNPIEGCPVMSAKVEREQLGVHADKMARIEGPNPRYNCFGHLFLDKKGRIHDADEIIEDDTTLTETPQAKDLLIGRHPKTGKAVHGAEIRRINPNGEISHVLSKEDTGGLYLCKVDIVKERYEELIWEIRRKKPSSS